MTQERRKESKINLMTQSTYESLLQEVEVARGNAKQSLLDIGEAAGTGSDWHDNAAFDHANIRHDVDSLLLSGMATKLRDVEIITPSTETDSIGIGNSVIVKYRGESDEEIFTILGPADSRRRPGWISFESALGENLLGKKAGDEISFEVEGQRQKLNIIKILPGDF